MWTFKELKQNMLEYVYDANCNIALLNAIKYSKTLDDLRCCVKEASGVGSEGFCKSYNWIFNKDLVLDIDRCSCCGQEIEE